MEPNDATTDEDRGEPMKDRNAWAVIGLLNVPWACAAVWCLWQMLK